MPTTSGECAWMMGMVGSEIKVILRADAEYVNRRRRDGHSGGMIIIIIIIMRAFL